MMEAGTTVAAKGPSHRSLTIDGLRALAVLLVVMSHTFPGNRAVMDVGDRGVDLFFVLSGLCLSLALARETAPRIVPFMVARFARIAPPYYLALALYAVLGMTAFGYPTATAGADLGPHAIASGLGMDVLFNTGDKPVHDAAFWTLSIEMRWYVLCLPLTIFWWRSRPLFLATGLALYALYWLTPFGFPDAGTLPCFMLGIVAGSFDPRAFSPRAAAAAGVATVLLAGAAIASTHGSPVVDHGDPLWHLAVFAVVVCGRLAPYSHVFAWRPLAMVGTASYAIYLVHQPVIESLLQRGVAPPLAALAGLAAGFAFWYAVERPLARPETRAAFVARVMAAIAPGAAERRVRTRPAA